MYCDVERVRVATTLCRELWWLLLLWYCHWYGGVMQLTVSDAWVRYVRTWENNTNAGKYSLRDWSSTRSLPDTKQEGQFCAWRRPSALKGLTGSASSTIVMVCCLFRLRVVPCLSVDHWFSAHGQEGTCARVCLLQTTPLSIHVYHTWGEHNDPLYTHVYTLFQYIDVHSNSVCVSVCLKWPSTQKCHIVATCFTIVSHTICLYIQYDMRMNTSLWWIQLGGSHQLYTHVAIIRVHSIGWFQYKTPRIVIGRRRAALKCTQDDIMSSVSQVLSA